MVLVVPRERSAGAAHGNAPAEDCALVAYDQLQLPIVWISYKLTVDVEACHYASLGQHRQPPVVRQQSPSLLHSAHAHGCEDGCEAPGACK